MNSVHHTEVQKEINISIQEMKGKEAKLLGKKLDWD